MSDYSHQARPYRKPLTTLLCFFWTVRILCCDDTTTRALFYFQVFGFSSCLTLSVYILSSTFGSMGMAHRGITGV
jgi:hypothetical protein